MEALAAAAGINLREGGSRHGRRGEITGQFEGVEIPNHVAYVSAYVIGLY